MEEIAKRVWADHSNEINKIKAGLLKRYPVTRRDYSFEDYERICQNVFFEHFGRYWSNDPQTYMKIYYRCLQNALRAVFKSNVRWDKCIEQCKSNWKEVATEKEMFFELYFNDLKEFVYKSCGEFDCAVFDCLLEGWNKKEMVEILECSVDKINNSIDKLRHKFINEINLKEEVRNA